MKFTVTQSVAVPPARAIAAYGSADFYDVRDQEGDVGVRGVVDRKESDDRVRIDVRFAFTGSVSGAVRAVVDPEKMTWVTKIELVPDLARATWDVVPDHYPSLLSASGMHRFEPAGDGPAGTTVHVEGELTVHVPFVGGTVERAIVTGLRTYIEEEVASLATWGGEAP